ncbi:MAG: mechanosensitive ion channel domain-containing protein [bacterium]
MNGTYRMLKLLCLLLTGCVLLESGFAQEAAQITPAQVEAATAAAERNPEALIQSIQAKQKELSQVIQNLENNISAMISAATGIAGGTEAVMDRMEYYRTIDLSYSQQITLLERQQELNHQLTTGQVDAGQAELEEPVPFLELDRMRAELEQRSHQQETLARKVELAEAGLQQAQATLKERQNQLEILQDQLNFAREPQEQERLLAAMQTMQIAIRSASERVQLQQMELENERLASTVFQQQLERLRNQIDSVHQVVFTEEHLNEQLKVIQDRRFALGKELKEANAQKEQISRRLTSLQNKLAQSETPDETLQEEVKARQLELDYSQVRAEVAGLILDLLTQREELWLQRYQLFNQLVPQEEWEDWLRNSAEQLKALEQEREIFSLRATERQNEISALRTRIEGMTDSQNPIRKWLSVRLTVLQNIQDVLNQQIGEINRNYALQEKLQSEIKAQWANQSWLEHFQSWSKMEYFNNSVWSWTIALILFLVILGIFFLVHWFLNRTFRPYINNNRRLIFSEVGKGVQRLKSFFFIAIALYFASLYLVLRESTRDFLESIVLLIVIFQFGLIISTLVQSWILRYLARKSKKDATSMGALAIFNFISQVVVWSIVVITALNNLGFDVTALVTGLGIGGLAVALALQTVLGDLFATISIILDKPFVIGDFIIFDDFMGSVERIGIKTTRIRSLSGEQIICSNNGLLTTRIRNYKRMHERRVVFTFRVTYDTPPEKLELIPGIVREIIQPRDDCRFDRAHFFKYGEFSLDFEVVYYVLSPDYNVYMDIQQTINLEINRRFRDLDIHFAIPAQKLFMHPTEGNRGEVNQ